MVPTYQSKIIMSRIAEVLGVDPAGETDCRGIAPTGSSSRPAPRIGGPSFPGLTGLARFARACRPGKQTKDSIFIISASLSGLLGSFAIAAIASSGTADPGVGPLEKTLRRDCLPFARIIDVANSAEMATGARIVTYVDVYGAVLLQAFNRAHQSEAKGSGLFVTRIDNYDSLIVGVISIDRSEVCGFDLVTAAEWRELQAVATGQVVEARPGSATLGPA
jgi:hypothetical protein